MKREPFLNAAKGRGLLAGFAVLLTAAIFTLAGCDTGNNGGGFVPVINIVNLPSIALQNEPLTLSGIVVPSNAANTTITWTSPRVVNGVFTAPSTGDFYVTAVVENGLPGSLPYTKPFKITAYDNSSDSITEAQGTWKNGEMTWQLDGASWTCTGFNVYEYGATVTESKGIMVRIDASSYVSQVNEIYIPGVGWYPWYSKETGAYTLSNYNNTVELTADTDSFSFINGTWTRQP
ncbi:MAG: hypothetical protein LBQ55_06745 [Treponema sp.]|jgi:hypothetical protein|nr:hypothetical protein [Treponema sp.]